MLQEVEVLFNADLVAGLIDLIKKAKNTLLLVSPYVDLDNRIIDVLREKKKLHDFKLYVLFGKNDQQYSKSIKAESLNFLKDFPNVEIRYNCGLHAKFYQSEFAYILTSMNLYDYSLRNNIEVGVRCQLKGSGLLHEAVDNVANALTNGIEKIKHGIAGTPLDTDPVREFHNIFAASTLLYKTAPVLQERKTISGLFTNKTLVYYEVRHSILDEKNYATSPAQLRDVSQPGSQSLSQPPTFYSGSKLCKLFNVEPQEWLNIVTKDGLIKDNQITDFGKAEGLIEKNYMGKSYIAYPEGLIQIKRLVPKK